MLRRLLVVALLATGLTGCVEEIPELTSEPVEASESFRSDGPFETEIIRRDVYDAAGSLVEERDFRLFKGTGNCCENYLMTSASGRIMDYGGTLIQYSDDEGRSWNEVPATLPYTNGEGAIANAPGGDIVAVGWDPYSGDQAYAHKWDNASQEWSYLPMPIHTPFWDREWVVSVPGPFELADGEAPYLTIARGGWPYKDILLFSGDGLTYASMSIPAVDSLAATKSLAALDLSIDPERDWLQPASETLISPLDHQLAIATFGACPMILDVTLAWQCLELTEATLPEGRILADSQGGLHVVRIDDAIHYHASQDGGRNWFGQVFPLPSGWSPLSWDFKAHAGLDQTIIAIHADTGEGAQDLFYRFNGLDRMPFLSEVVYAGPSGGETDSGVAAQGGRYDFMTVALLPDGRAILSVSGAELAQPALAVEL